MNNDCINGFTEVLAKLGVDCSASLPFSECRLTYADKLKTLGFEPQSAIMLLAPYRGEDSPARIVSAYAVSRDYHLFFRQFYAGAIPELQKLYPGKTFRGYADSSPIAEVEAAAKAGLGVIGKNGLLISKKYGSYVFIGEILTDAVLPDMSGEIGHCPDCGLCRRSCPSPDDCLSGLTQKKGELSESTIALMRKYRTAWGCDICQDVCPLNRGASYSEIGFFRTDLRFAPRLGEDLTDRAYGWRGRQTLERDLKVIYGSAFMTQDILDKVGEIVKAAGRIVLEAEDRGVDGETVSEKAGSGNFVTDYDVRVQKYLRENLTKLIPGALFIGEESGEGEAGEDAVNSGVSFVVDPIDGTTNFIRGMRRSAISAAVCECGTVTAGVVYDPFSGELFSARRGGGARLNGRPIHCASNALRDGLTLVGTSPYYRELNAQTLALIGAFLRRSLDLRRSGSAALDISYVACGCADVMFESRLSPWDYAAASLILTEAGGKISEYDGGRVVFHRPCSVLAASGTAYGEALDTVKAAVADAKAGRSPEDGEGNG